MIQPPTKLNRVEHIEYLVNRLKWRAKEQTSSIRAKYFSSSPIAAMGAYYSSNLGDKAMGEVISRFLQNSGVKVDCLSHTKFPKDKFYESLICGGGEIGDEKYFNTGFSLCKDPSQIRIIGISPYAGLHMSNEATLVKLSKVPFISVRNLWAKQYLSKLLHRNDIRYAPDLAFSLPIIFPTEFRHIEDRSQKKVNGTAGINIVPYGCSILRNGEIVEDHEWHSMLAKLYPHMTIQYRKLTSNYISYTRNLIEQLSDQGYRVVNIALSFGDYIFAKNLFSNMNIEIFPPARSVLSAVEQISSLDVLFACRFHSYVFCILGRTSFKPFAYSMKCANLLSDLNLRRKEELFDRDILATTSPYESAQQHMNTPAIKVTDNEIHKIAINSHDSLEALVSSFNSKEERTITINR